jgi:hypothetical protein
MNWLLACLENTLTIMQNPVLIAHSSSALLHIDCLVFEYIIES